MTGPKAPASAQPTPQAPDSARFLGHAAPPESAEQPGVAEASASGPVRREVLATLAALVVLRWTDAGAVVPVEAPLRVRAGAPVRLYHPDATAFRVETAGLPTVEVPARAGRVQFRAPEGAGEGFAPLCCTPLKRGRSLGVTAEVAVLSGKVLFGA